MKLTEVSENMFSVFVLGEEILYLYKNKIVNVSSNREVVVWTAGNVYRNNSIVASISNNKIELHDSFLNYIANIEHDEINYESGITLLDENNIVIHNFTKSDNLFYFTQSKLVNVIHDFWGLVLDKKYILKYPEGVFNNPRSFRCSDLLDTVTYWEYDCSEEYVASRFYVWNSKLVFSKSKGTDVRLVLIDLPTGKIDWEVKIIYGAFFFDDQSGVLASVWGSRKEGGKYQIIHLQKQLVEIGEIEEFNMEYVRVNWETQFLASDKYYFTETVYTTADEKPSPIKFGCFDIETKKIDFLQEVPEAAGSQIAQVIYHEDKLYLRTSGNELFVFSEE